MSSTRSTLAQPTLTTTGHVSPVRLNIDKEVSTCGMQDNLQISNPV